MNEPSPKLRVRGGLAGIRRPPTGKTGGCLRRMLTNEARPELRIRGSLAFRKRGYHRRHRLANICKGITGSDSWLLGRDCTRTLVRGVYGACEMWVVRVASRFLLDDRKPDLKLIVEAYTGLRLRKSAK